MPTTQTLDAQTEWEVRDEPAPEELTEPLKAFGTWEKTPSRLSDRLAAIARKELDAEIDRSQKILDLKEDWDGDQSPGYKAETLDRAISFLITHSEWLWKSYGIKAPVPRIGPGPDGSIDLYWKRKAWELLVNIPADTSKRATFYGDNYGPEKTRGSFDPGTVNLSVAAWLIGR